MKTIVLISCSASKNHVKAKAKNLYKGDLFQLSLKYAYSLNPSKIFILSALYYLVPLEKEIEPYDVTLCYVSPKERLRKPILKVLTKREIHDWGIMVGTQLAQESDLNKDKFVLLAGQSYVKPIRKLLTNVEEPLKGLSQGRRVKYLKELLIN